MSQLLPVRQVIKERILPIGPSKFYSEVREQRLTLTKIGRRSYLTRDEIDRYIGSLPRVNGRLG